MHSHVGILFLKPVMTDKSWYGERESSPAENYDILLSLKIGKKAGIIGECQPVFVDMEVLIQSVT
jgi:hypothetical protein